MKNVHSCRLSLFKYTWYVPNSHILAHIMSVLISSTIANYVVWSIMQNRVNNLPSRFKELQNEFNKVCFHIFFVGSSSSITNFLSPF